MSPTYTVGRNQGSCFLTQNGNKMKGVGGVQENSVVVRALDSLETKHLEQLKPFIWGGDGLSSVHSSSIHQPVLLCRMCCRYPFLEGHSGSPLILGIYVALDRVLNLSALVDSFTNEDINNADVLDRISMRIK